MYIDLTNQVAEWNLKYESAVKFSFLASQSSIGNLHGIDTCFVCNVNNYEICEMITHFKRKLDKLIIQKAGITQMKWNIDTSLFHFCYSLQYIENGKRECVKETTLRWKSRKQTKATDGSSTPWENPVYRLHNIKCYTKEIEQHRPVFPILCNSPYNCKEFSKGPIWKKHLNMYHCFNWFNDIRRSYRTQHFIFCSFFIYWEVNWLTFSNAVIGDPVMICMLWN